MLPWASHDAKKQKPEAEAKLIEVIERMLEGQAMWMAFQVNWAPVVHLASKEMALLTVNLCIDLCD